ncbi:MAG: ROK family protein [SAR202 cluster bacterium]|nr:ROK family protein [SAR202 cluster bacterium]
MADAALVADIGGTNLRAALVDREGKILSRRATRTDVKSGGTRMLDRLMAVLKETAADSGGSFAGIGLAVASPTDPSTGTLYNPPNLPDWDGFSPMEALTREYPGARIIIGNDANLAALAVHHFGQGRGLRNVIYMTVSTGIGGGIIINGEMYEGSRGFAGEFGHIVVLPNGPKCPCGRTGCLEALASGTAVARSAQKRIIAGEPSTLAGKGPASRIDAVAVAAAAEAGDALAKQVIDEAAYYLGIGISVVINSFDPDIVVIGGGMSNSLDLLRTGIMEQVKRHAIADSAHPVPIVKSDLGDDIGLLGAAAKVFGEL